MGRYGELDLTECLLAINKILLECDVCMEVFQVERKDGQPPAVHSPGDDGCWREPRDCSIYYNYFIFQFATATTVQKPIEASKLSILVL